MTGNEVELKDIASILESIASVLMIVGLVWIVKVLSKLPGSEVSFKLPIGEGRVSIEDAGWMIKERLNDVTEEQAKALEIFASNDPSVDELSQFSQDILEALIRHELVEGDAAKKDLRLKTWGYRVLKNVRGIPAVPPWKRN